MTNPIQEILSREPFVVIDGGGATELEARGCDLNDSLWSAKVLLEAPDIVTDVHRAYLRAGADIIKSMTYQSSHAGFKEKGLSDQDAEKAVQLGITIALDAVKQQSRKCYVAAAVGPYGAYLANGSEYTGHYGVTDTVLRDFHRKRLESFMEAGANFLAVETIPELAEAHLLAELMHEYNISGWITFSCKNEQETCGGDRIGEAIRVLEHYEEVAALGVNCTHPRYISAIIHELKDNSMGPYIVYPNAGESYDPVSKTWHADKGYDDFYPLAAKWYNDGARVIGGCCRTTPKDIRRISDLRIDIRQGARL